MKRILVVAGTPGVGKTSISNILASRLRGLHIDLTKLVKDEELSSGYNSRHNTLLVDVVKVRQTVEEMLKERSGYIIVEGHFAMDIVALEDVSLAFILRRNPLELRLTLRERGFEEKKVIENVVAEVLDVCLIDSLEAYGKEKVCEINVSGKTAESVIDEILEVINGHKKCTVGVVDWLIKLESEGLLEEFFEGF